MIGQVIYERTDSDMSTYRETVILEEDTVQLILCTEGQDFKLYRINAPGDNLLNNHACYTWKEVKVLFQRAIDFTVMNRAQEAYKIKMQAYLKAQ